MDDWNINARLAPKCMGTLSRWDFNQPSMLCLDAFRGHLTNKVEKKKHRLGSDLNVPGGMTSVLQPLDISLNTPFMAYVQAEYEKLFCEPHREQTLLGKIIVLNHTSLHTWFLLPGKSSMQQ